jgi:hypothetical protein
MNPSENSVAFGASGIEPRWTPQHRAISRGSSIIPGLSDKSCGCCANESPRWVSDEPELAQTMSKRDAEPVVLTVGHSTRPLAEFIALLKAHSVVRLIDVRTVPRSRYNPQFNRDCLPAALAADGISYEHVAGLGGFRRTHPGSLNTGWRNVSFRGYADYMQTPEFAEHLTELIARATRQRIVLMCAEAVPWRCHRSLIADALVVHGLRVEEIISGTRRQAHALTPFARVTGTVVTYPPEASPLQNS